MTGLIRARLPPQKNATPIEQSTEAMNVYRRFNVSCTTRRKFFMEPIDAAGSWRGVLLAKDAAGRQDRLGLPGFAGLCKLARLPRRRSRCFSRREMERLHS